MRALDEATRARVEGLYAHHSLYYSQSKLGHHPAAKPDSEYSGYGFHAGPVPLRPLVKTHPETGRKSLYLASHAGAIIGWPITEARALSVSGLPLISSMTGKLTQPLPCSTACGQVSRLPASLCSSGSVMR